MKKLLTVLWLAAVCGVPALAAGPLERPAGAVVLTIAGDISETNRGPFDPVGDGVLKFHDRKFGRAAAFDLAMLEALGTHSATIAFGNWPAPITFSGPRLADVLAAVGWDGDAITTLALDGFGTTIGRAEIERRDWILATRADGKPLAIGGRGPLWLVFDPPGDRPATVEEEHMWPWALFYIEAE